MRMLELINNKFAYRKGITTAASPITEMLEHGQGVCQDFTHLMIGLARALGIPARYVSGLLHPEARALPRLHADARVVRAALSLRRLGRLRPDQQLHGRPELREGRRIGRDFRDVPPNKGIYRGKPTNDRRAGPQRGAPPSPRAGRRANSVAPGCGRSRCRRPAAGCAASPGPATTAAHGTGGDASSVITLNFTSRIGPNEVVSATSTASRPRAMSTRTIARHVPPRIHRPPLVIEIDL